jgi:hypothetical protein
LLSGKIESMGVMGCARDQLDACYGRQPLEVLINMVGTGLCVGAPCECEQANHPP